MQAKILLTTILMFSLFLAVSGLCREYFMTHRDSTNWKSQVPLLINFKNKEQIHSLQFRKNISRSIDKTIINSKLNTKYSIKSGKNNKLVMKLESKINTKEKWKKELHKELLKLQKKNNYQKSLEKWGFQNF